MSATSKLNAEWQFLEHLRDLGRAKAEAWLDENFDKVGTEPTFDLKSILQ